MFISKFVQTKVDIKTRTLNVGTSELMPTRNRLTLQLAILTVQQKNTSAKLPFWVVWKCIIIDVIIRCASQWLFFLI